MRLVTYYRILRAGAERDGVPDHEHDGTDLSGEAVFLVLRADRIYAGVLEVVDIISEDWNGANPPDLSGGTQDPTATAGYALDSSGGAAQFNGDVFLHQNSVLFVGGSLNATGTLFANAFTQGVDGWRLNPTGSVEFYDPVFVGDHSAASPSVRRLGTADGLFFASGVLGVAVTGTEVARFTAGQLSLVNGDATTPALGATADTDTGVFFDTAVVGVTAAGAEVARFTGTAGHNLDGLAWTTWSPTWTNLTIGNGTQVARYIRIGDLVIARLELIFGSTTSISGAISVTIPITASSSGYTAGRQQIGNAWLEDNSAAGDVLAHINLNDTGRVGLQALTASGTYVSRTAISSTVPFTWATDDKIAFTIIYEAA